MPDLIPIVGAFLAVGALACLGVLRAAHRFGQRLGNRLMDRTEERRRDTT